MSHVYMPLPYDACEMEFSAISSCMNKFGPCLPCTIYACMNNVTAEISQILPMLDSVSSRKLVFGGGDTS